MFVAVSMDLQLIYNYKYIFVIMVVLNMLYFIFDGSSFNGIDKVQLDSSPFRENKKYIIDTPGCRIENLNPYSEEIKEYIYTIKKITCRNKGLLTYISRFKDKVILNLNMSLLPEYSIFHVDCCYSVISRNPTGSKPDDNISFSDCIPFHDTVHIKHDFIRVECSNFFQKVYVNVHSTLQPPKEVATNAADPNVLLIGIDGVSRSNLIRSMPRTYQFCERNRWINLKGYNKIADNTYPNLMAVLSGMNFSQAESVCDPYDKVALDNCQHFIWREFKRHNYSTAYAEDTSRIGTFNWIKAGFTNPPTDYYFRPYFLAAEDLSIKYLCLRAHCTGPEKTGIRMQNLIKDFVSTIRNATPGFGLFWMNSFSHEDVNCPSSLDDDFVDFFEEMERGGEFNNTIVIFFSDHGFRFGKIRLTHTGWMEERLPFIYIRIPESFRLKHLEAYSNLVSNSDKLTTPYDIHMTLQHILSLSNKNYVESPSQGCPQCKSLFKPIESSRTCGTSGIPQPYCTCSRYENLSKKTPLVREVANFFISHINNLVKSYGEASKGCSVYFLDKISHAKSLVIEKNVEENVLVGVVANPDAIFEANVKVIYNSNATKTFTLMETNRLDRYAPKTFCVQNSPVQMYCYCKSLLKRITNEKGHRTLN
ncbi:hypothetical protein NQ315_003027 [Exocentrus adspersus]|uniref:DUF229 domain containing protein n=1 Tax=Exocentrus adspersus TaxID=1586481 RepID=A0AAV8W4S1_9CUCU|nr:hypothetical protein NQ315_003027 [Exocentrus adspersus]